MYKNVSGQKFTVFATDADGVPVTGDAANITAQISKDFGAGAATNDTNPTERDATDFPGIYDFDALQAETNADNVLISAVSSTSGVTIEPREYLPEDLTMKGIVAFGTAQSASATGVVLESGDPGADDVRIGQTIAVFGSTQGYWQSRIITDNALSGTAVTVNTWTVTPSGTITYRIYASAPGASLSDIGTAVATAVQASAIADPLHVNMKEQNDVPFVTFEVQTNGGNTASAFETDLTQTEDDHWVWNWAKARTGDLAGQRRRITSYDGTTKVLSVQAFTDVPADGVVMELLP